MIKEYNPEYETGGKDYFLSHAQLFTEYRIFPLFALTMALLASILLYIKKKWLSVIDQLTSAKKFVTATRILKIKIPSV